MRRQPSPRPRVDARRGQGWIAGILAGVPLLVVERQACTNSVRMLVTAGAGKPLHLSRKHRLLSPAQRESLTVAAGGTCQFQGYRVPHPHLKTHHADWWDRDDGETDIDNGASTQYAP